MKRKNFPKRKAQRREEAEARQEKYDKCHKEEKVKLKSVLHEEKSDDT